MKGFKDSTKVQYMRGGPADAYAKGGSVKGAAKIAKVMGEFKRGDLRSGSKEGPKVTDPKQAKAVAMSEARKASAPAKKGVPVTSREPMISAGRKKYAEGGMVMGTPDLPVKGGNPQKVLPPPPITPPQRPLRPAADWPVSPPGVTPPTKGPPRPVTPPSRAPVMRAKTSAEEARDKVSLMRDRMALGQRKTPRIHAPPVFGGMPEIPDWVTPETPPMQEKPFHRDPYLPASKGNPYGVVESPQLSPFRKGGPVMTGSGRGTVTQPGPMPPVARKAGGLAVMPKKGK